MQNLALEKAFWFLLLYIPLWAVSENGTLSFSVLKGTI